MRRALEMELANWLGQLGLPQLEGQKTREETARQLSAPMIGAQVLRPAGGCNLSAFRTDRPFSLR